MKKKLSEIKYEIIWTMLGILWIFNSINNNYDWWLKITFPILTLFWAINLIISIIQLEKMIDKVKED